MTTTSTGSPRIGRRFTVLWAGQTASLLGSNVSAAGVSIAAYVETGSVWWLSVLYLAVRLPGLLLASWAGALVDRSDRRTVLVVADLAAGIATFAALGLLAAGQLDLWHLVVVAVVAATASAFQEPAYLSALPLLVPRDAIDRAQGMLQIGPALGLLAGPAIAGVLLGTGGIGAVLLFDAATFIVAVLAAARTPVPRPDDTATGHTTVDVRGLRATWRSLTGRTRGLRHLLVYAGTLNLVLSMVNVLLFALLVPLAGETGAGLLLSAGGVAMLATAATLSARGVPARRVATLVAGTAALGLGAVLMGLRPNTAVVALGLMLTLAGAAVATAAAGTLFQTEVAASMQGRLTALRRVSAEALMPVSVLAVAPLTEHLAAPSMAPGGALAATVGRVLGTGHGRGAALLFVLVGLAVLAVSAGMARDRGLRVLDRAAAPAPQPASAPDPQPAAAPDPQPAAGSAASHAVAVPR